MGVTNSKFTSQQAFYGNTNPTPGQPNRPANTTHGSRSDSNTNQTGVSDLGDTQTENDDGLFSKIELRIDGAALDTCSSPGIKEDTAVKFNDDLTQVYDTQFKTVQANTLQTVLFKDLYIRHPSDRHSCWVTDLESLSDGAVALVDHNNDCIKVLDVGSNTFIGYITIGLANKPWAVCRDGSNNLVVTCGYDIVTIDLDTFTITRQIKVTDWTRGIVVDKDVLIYACSSPRPAVKVVTREGLVVNSLELNQDGHTMFVCPWSIAASEDKNFLYVCDCGNNTVTCINRRDDTQTVYKHRSLTRPQSLTIGPRDYLFVTGQCNVHGVKLDFSHNNVILNVQKCHGACFDAKNKLLYVSYDWSSNKSNFVSIYRIN